LAERSSKQANGSKTGRQPISRHPLFPVIVALWFATLIGMGSLALRTGLIENLVLAGHIDSLIPAAAPPLGATARLMLAVVLGVPSGVIGWVLAKRVGAPKSHAGPQVFNVADADLGAQWPGVAEAPTHIEAAAPEPAATEPAPVLDPSRFARDNEEEAPLPAAETVVEQEAIPAPSGLTAAQRIAAASLADLSHVELVERLAIALQRRDELLGTPSNESAEIANPVLHFPDFADRRTARLAPPVAQSRPAPQETEKALRAALAQLERMSGTA
jgi:hypothetical protein